MGNSRTARQPSGHRLQGGAVAGRAASGREGARTSSEVGTVVLVSG